MKLAACMELGTMDDLGRMDTPVHRLDARALALTTLAFIIAVMSFPRQAISPLTPFLLYPVLLMAFGRIPPRAITRKVLLAAPFALCLGLFNPVLNREPAILLGPVALSAGWVSLISLLLRFVLTASAALVLVACTGMYRLGSALARLGVPRIFVVQLLFLHRYLFVISDQAVTMARAVELRAGGRPLRFRAYTVLVAHLLIRSLDRADRVHRARLARGFDGTIRLLKSPALRWRDAAFAGGCISLFILARLGNPALPLGRWIERMVR